MAHENNEFVYFPEFQELLESHLEWANENLGEGEKVKNYIGLLNEKVKLSHLVFSPDEPLQEKLKKLTAQFHEIKDFFLNVSAQYDVTPDILNPLRENLQKAYQEGLCSFLSFPAIKNSNEVDGRSNTIILHIDSPFYKGSNSEKREIKQYIETQAFNIQKALKTTTPPKKRKKKARVAHISDEGDEGKEKSSFTSIPLKETKKKKKKKTTDSVTIDVTINNLFVENNHTPENVTTLSLKNLEEKLEDTASGVLGVESLTEKKSQLEEEQQQETTKITEEQQKLEEQKKQFEEKKKLEEQEKQLEEETKLFKKLEEQQQEQQLEVQKKLEEEKKLLEEFASASQQLKNLLSLDIDNEMQDKSNEAKLQYLDESIQNLAKLKGIVLENFKKFDDFSPELEENTNLVCKARINLLNEKKNQLEEEQQQEQQQILEKQQQPPELPELPVFSPFKKMQEIKKISDALEYKIQELKDHVYTRLNSYSFEPDTTITPETSDNDNIDNMPDINTDNKEVWNKHQKDYPYKTSFKQSDVEFKFDMQEAQTLAVKLEDKRAAFFNNKQYLINGTYNAKVVTEFTKDMIGLIKAEENTLKRHRGFLGQAIEGIMAALLVIPWGIYKALSKLVSDKNVNLLGHNPATFKKAAAVEDVLKKLPEQIKNIITSKAA